MIAIRLVRFFLIIVAGLCFATSPSWAQDTNANLFLPLTKLEAFETNVGIVIIKATTEIGTLSANAGLLTVKCKEMTDTSTGRREIGLAIDLEENRLSRDTRLIDYDELIPFLTAIDYLNKVDWSVTSLNSFDASYTTKSGFRIAAFSSRRSGTIEFALRTTPRSTPPLLLTRDQVAQFRSLIDQAKDKLDALRQNK